jgi:hypothetical protein
MATRSERKGKKVTKAELFKKNKGKACNKKTKKYSEKIACVDCGITRYVMKSDLHHTKRCFDHAAEHDKYNRKMRMRKYRMILAKKSRSSSKRQVRKAA